MGDNEAFSIQQKLVLENGIINLPNPDALDSWQLGQFNMPDVNPNCVEDYFRRINKNRGEYTTEEALRLGKELCMSGHVDTLLHHEISPNIYYCFVKTEVIEETNTANPPYKVWIIVREIEGAVEAAYCSCAGGIAGSCKHVAAVLYTMLVTTGHEISIPCTSRPQTRKTLVELNAPVRPNAIRRSKRMRLRSDYDTERKGPKSSLANFDPRAPADRTPSDIWSFDLEELARITGGNAAILCSLGIKTPEDAKRQRELHAKKAATSKSSV